MKEQSDASPRFPLRQLGPAEAEIDPSLRLKGLKENPEAFAASFEEEARRPLSWFSDRLQSSSVFGGFAGADLVGVAGLRAETTAKLAHIGPLGGLYVAPPARGQGLGATLCRRLVAEARGRVEQIRLAVVSCNSAAIALYAGLGFKRYGLERRALTIGDEYYDELLMMLRLNGTGL